MLLCNLLQFLHRRISLLFMVFFCLFPSSCLCRSMSSDFTTNIPHSEFSALNDLYKSTNGSYWSYNLPINAPNPARMWNFTSYFENFPCRNQWYGLQCATSTDNSSIHITSIFLENFHLSGTIPTSIDAFSNLTQLSTAINKVIGPIPSTIGNLFALEQLNLQSNPLDTTLPDSLSQLSNLQSLIMTDCLLYGKIPTNIGGMVSLETLALSYNFLTGDLPASIGECTKLQYLGISNNLLNGTLPDTFGNLQSLTVFYVNSNQLIGTLSNSLCELTNLEDLQTYGNGFTGSIPENIGNLKKLEALYLYANSLNGTIPESLYNCTQLVTLLLDNNQLTGTISSKIGQLQQVDAISLTDNKLHGSLPDSLSALTKNLAQFYAANNRLTGTLPPSLSNLNYSLRTIYVGGNLIHGSIPETYCELVSLLALEILNNMLTGTVPTCFHKLEKLHQIYLQNNFFSGPLPFFNNSVSLVEVELNNNQFTGTTEALFRGGGFSAGYNGINIMNLNNNFLTGSLSAHVQQFINLQVGNNLMSGTLPHDISIFNQLETFFANKNMFTGRLESVFNSRIQLYLINIDVSDNQFTGAVPSEVFLMPSIQSFAAVSNCFSGELPVAEMCGAETLITLALDGLMSASSCQNRFFASYTGIDSYWLRQEFTDRLPACLFELPELNILHLSGNGFVSSIPQGVNIGSQLSDLSLSNNKLKGEIPSEIQYKHWQNLDLSYNKLGGTLRSDYPVPEDGETTSLDVNRLSATIPRALTDAKLISLLDGNLFACSVDRSELPVHDSSVNDYECGSTTLNYALYVWIGIGVSIVTGVCVVGYLSGRGQHLVRKSQQYLAVFSNEVSGSDSLVQFGSFLSDLRSFFVLSVAVLFVASLLVNIALSVYFNSYAYEYAWNIASVYLSGTTPAAVLFCLYLAAAVFVVFAARRFHLVTKQQKESPELIYRPSISSGILSGDDNASASDNIGNNNSSSSNSRGENKQTVNSWSLTQYLSVSLSVLFNVAVIVGVNIAYVFVNQTCSYDAVQATQVALSVFKVAWNNLAVRSVLKQMKAHSSPSGGDNRHSEKSDRKDENHGNNVGDNDRDSDKLLQQFAGESGSVVEAVTDTSQSQRNTGEFTATSTSTTTHSLEIAVFIMLFNNLAAPFIAIALVNSNCFYNVITTPPAVSVSYLYTSCAYYDPDPITGQLKCQSFDYGTDERTTSYIPPFTYSYQCSSAFITTYAPVYILMFIIMSFVSPALLGLLKYGHSISAIGSSVHKTLSKILPNILKPIEEKNMHNIEHSSSSKNGSTWGNTVFVSLLDVVFSKRLFDCDVFVVQLVSILTVALTFGVVFPPILVVACIALLSVTYCTQLLIGRYVVKAGSGNNRVLVYQIHSDVSHAKDMFVSSIWMVVPFAVVFYSFLLFDILGDDVGWEKAVWMPLVLIVLAILWPVVVKCRRLVATRANGRRITEPSSEHLSEGLLSRDDINKHAI